VPAFRTFTTCVAGQRGEQRHGRLRVKGTAPLAEQLRLAVKRGVGVHLQQPPLDPGDFLRSRRPAPLCRHDRVVRVEIAQVIGRNRANFMNNGYWQPSVPSDLGAMGGDQGGQPVGAVHHGGSFPGQVIEPDMVEQHLPRRDAE
jgi:hypothetical protein